MPAAINAPPGQSLFATETNDADALPVLRAIVLVRVACKKGATLTDVVRSFAPLVAGHLTPAQWRDVARGELAHLIDGGLAIEYRQRVSATEAGRTAADAFLGRKDASNGTWNDIRDGRLIAKALEMEGVGPKRLERLMQPDGLRAVILMKAYRLSQRVRPTPARLRAALARVALERSFGDRVRDGLSDGNGFTASDGRLLAGQLARRPRTFSSDSKLIAVLAAEAVGARQTDLDSLRAAVLGDLFETALSDAHVLRQMPDAKAAGPRSISTIAKDHAALNAPSEKGPHPAGLTTIRVKPTLADFAKDVTAAAAVRAEGWPGNYKAFIADVFAVIEDRRPEWGLNAVAFKCMLTEAHLAGLIELTGVDLKKANDKPALEASEITYKNTSWHQIRVTEGA